MSSSRSERWRHACSLVAISLVLTACGGGGSDPRKTAIDDRTRQAADARKAADAAYLVIDSNPSQSGSKPHKLHLVDPNTGVVFLSIDIGQHGSYELAGAFTPSANGQGGLRENASVLFFIREHDNGQRQLFTASLVGTQAGVETRVSSLADACSIKEAQPARLDAIATWLRVLTAGSDHDCEQGQDNQYVFVRSDFASSADPVVSPFGAEEVLAWEYNAQGELTWIYGYVPQLGALRAVNATTAEIREVTGGFTGQPVRAFSQYPGNANKVLVRVDRTVRALSWLNGVATLGATITTLADPYEHVLAVDDQGVYFTEGLMVQRIGAQGTASTLTSLPSSGGQQVQVIAQTPTSLLVGQGLGDSSSSPSSGSGGVSSPAPALPDSLLWVVAKNGATANRLVETLPGTVGGFVAGVSGETVVYGTTTESSSSRGYVTLKRFVANVALQEPTTVASGIRYLSGFSSRQVDAYGDGATAYLLWCDVAGQANNCRADRLRSYSLATGELVNLGPLSLAADSPAWELYGDIDYADRSGRGLLEAFQDPSMQVDEFKWLLKAGQPQSLKEIILP